jgi:anaerobic selenocysteine-containing dehydrogenase
MPNQRLPKKIITACTMDCPDACSLVISEDVKGRFKIQGNPKHPITAGFTCAKIKKHIRRLKSPNRIRHPLLKVKGQWQPISWAEALELCAAKIQECRHQPTSILHIPGDGAKGVSKLIPAFFFAQLGASRARGSLCDAAGYMAYVRDFGSRENHAVQDLLNAAQIVIWGKDLSRTSIHMAAIVKKARRRGTKILGITPGGDDNQTFRDDTLILRPGTDRFLAAAAIKRIIANGATDHHAAASAKNWRTFRALIDDMDADGLMTANDVSPDMIETVYRYYMASGPTATIVGTGLQRYRYGGENVRFINALALLSGNIGVSGGGSHYHLHSMRNLNTDWIKPKQAPKRRSLRLPIIGREILDAHHPPIRMLWVNGTNVINQVPNSHLTAKAFQEVQFKVVVDAFMTDTAESADLVLPSTLMLEQEDITASYWHSYIHYVEKGIEPPEAARSDDWIMRELGKRLAPPIIIAENDIFFQKALSAPPLSVSLQSLRQKKYIRCVQPEVAYEGCRFKHADGLYRLPNQLHNNPAAPANYPLRLLSLVRRDHIHSQILPEDQIRLPIVKVSPRCPHIKNLKFDKNVFLVSCIGKIKVSLELMDHLHPQAVIYRRGDWLKCGGGINQLISKGLTDIGSGAAYYEEYVRLENG